MRLASTLGLLAFAGLVAATPVLARADAPGDVPAKARALAERGRAQHEAGDYAAAIAAYTEAYALAPSPALLFNLAQAYRLGGHCDDAVTMYRRFLATDPEPEARALAEAHLIAVERCLDASPPLVVAPPPPVAAPHVSLPLAPRPSSGAHRAALERDASLGLGIGGGVALIGALAFELRAHGASTTVSDAYQHGGDWSKIADADARGRQSATLATAFGITGVVAIGASATLYWMSTRESRAQHVAIVPTLHGAEAYAAWWF